MPRWEHGSEDRLKRAAFELFEEQGFEKTSVIEIAKRASVTTRTFFRYFADKREVVFADSGKLRKELIDALLDASDLSKPLEAVMSVLSEFPWEDLGPRIMQKRRQAVIAASPELLERNLIKHHDIALGLCSALRQRGVGPEVARLAANIGIELFFAVYERWIETEGNARLAQLSKEAMVTLVSILQVEAIPRTPPSQAT